MDKKPISTTYFSLAGVVPVAGQPLDFNFPWHDSLIPIGKNYLAVERSVYECAIAGCESIWIVCHKEMQSFIRHRLGDYISDPMTSPGIKSHFVKHASEHIKYIPIYYVPIHPKDRDKRDCLAWSIIYGSMRAFSLSKLISKWTVPDKYYVSFPYGIHDPRQLQPHRGDISGKKKFYLSYEGKTVKDGEYLSFTFDAEDWKKFRRIIRGGTGKYEPGSYFDEDARTVKGEMLPIEERYSAKNYPLEKVFGELNLEEEVVTPCKSYYNIGNWEDYCEYMGSGVANVLKRPNYILKYHEHNPFGVDREEIVGSSEEKT